MRNSERYVFEEESCNGLVRFSNKITDKTIYMFDYRESVATYKEYCESLFDETFIEPYKYLYGGVKELGLKELPKIWIHAFIIRPITNKQYILMSRMFNIPISIDEKQ